MSNVQNYLIAPLENWFGKNLSRSIADKLIEDYRDVSPEILAHAALDLTEKSNQKTLPGMSHIRSAIGRVQRTGICEAKARTGIQPWDHAAQEKAYAAARHRAKEIVRADLDLARQADREGWLCGLIDFAQDHGRLPKGLIETEFCKAASRKSDLAIAQLRDAPVRSGQASLYPAICALRRNMLIRARADVFGGSFAENETGTAA